MATLEEPLRGPSTTQDLIHRVKSTDTSSKEKEALTNLCQCMIKTFKNDPQSNYTAEAASLAPILQREKSQELLQNLITTLGNKIIKGTADRNIPDIELLKAFAYVSWHANEVSHAKSNLGSVLASLATRLKNAKIAAELNTRYHLVCSISAILDSMIDIKTSGLSREDLREPLLKQLKGLSSDKDMRLAFAAAYAYQALLGIKDDEGPYQALWGYTTKGIQTSAKLAGAVSKMDPGAVLDALPSVNSVLSVVHTLYELGENVASILVEVNETKEWIDSLSNLSRQKGWYRALRYTELLLRAKAWSSTKQFVKRVPCHDEKDFLCGVFRQVEAMWAVAISNEDMAAQQNLKELFADLTKDVKSYKPITQAWAGLTGTTIGHSPHTLTVRQSRNPFKKAQSSSSDLAPFSAFVAPNPGVDELLRKAWSCTEAETSKIFYADISIQHRYKTGKALLIERLSDEPLPLEECYINLAIANQRDSDAKKSEPSGFSLEARLRLDAASGAGSIALETLFDERRLLNGLEGSPRRIFIRGRAGIGKSTMCKKIVHNFMKGTLSADRFDRLLWLSLRKLINKPEGYSWEILVADEFLDTNMPPEVRGVLAKVMGKNLGYERAFRERTLVLLDGLDEVSSRWANHTRMFGFLERLLQMPNIILTSRPQSKILDTGTFDLELETIGFLPEQVDAYIKHCITNENLAESMHKFLNQKPLIKSLMRIPVQLDAFCHVWQSKGHSKIQNISTMTLLYQAVCEELGKKDVIRLEKDFQVQSLGGFEIAQHLDNEQRFLNEFALQGLYNNVIEFDHDQQNMIAECVNRRGIRLQRGYRTILEQMSFLRTSGDDADTKARSYYFLHLTFQEFFAAKHWVEHWKFNKALEFVPLIAGANKIQVMPSEFLAKEKYNPRYNIFWRFVTGLIQANTDVYSSCGGLLGFMKALDAVSYDVFGYMHHRLLMYALSEITESGEPSICEIRTSVEIRLKRWALYEARLTYYSMEVSIPDVPREANALGSDTVLVSQEEFPFSIVNMLLQNTDARVVKQTLTSLMHRSYIPSSTLKPITAWIKTDSGLQEEAVIALCGQETLPQDVLSHLVTFCVQHGDSNVMKFVHPLLKRLRPPNDLVFQVLSRIVYLLEDQTGNGHIPPFFENAGLFCQHSYLSKDVLVTWTKMAFWSARLARDPNTLPANPFNWSQKFTMIDCLYGLSLAERLELVRHLLRVRYHMNQNLINTLRLLVQNLDTEARQDLLDSLSKHYYRQEHLKFLLPLLDDPNSEIRRATLNVFQRGFYEYFQDYRFMPDVEDALVRRLLDVNAKTRSDTMRILWRSASGPVKLRVISMLVLQYSLHPFTVEISPDLIRILCSQPQLPPAVAESICMVFGSKNETVVKCCLIAVECDCRLHPTIVNGITRLLEHPVSELQYMAIEILATQYNLDDIVIDTLIKFTLRQSVAQQRRLVQNWADDMQLQSTEIMTTLCTMLEDADGDTRLEAMLCLYNRTQFDERLRHWMLDERKEYSFRLNVIEELRERDIPNDPSAELKDWEVILRDQDLRIVNAAREAISYRFKGSKFLFSIFLKHLHNNCSRNGDLAFELRNRLGIREPRSYLFWKDTLLSQDTPSESLTLLACGMREIIEEFNLSPNGHQTSSNTFGRLLRKDETVTLTEEDRLAIVVAKDILMRAPDLPLQAWEILVKLWDNRVSTNLVPLRKILVDIFHHHVLERPLPPIVCNLIIDFCRQYDSSAIYPNQSYGIVSINTTLDIAASCSQLLEHRAVSIDTILNILNAQRSSIIARWLIGSMIVRGLELEFVHLFGDELLAVLCLQWIRWSASLEISCYRLENGLYLQRNGIETKLQFPTSDVDKVLGILKEAKKDLGFEETVEASNLSSSNLS